MGSREELEKIVGPTAVDERPVRDLWPLAIMQERAGNVPPQVLVVRPAGREQVAALLRWATSNRVAVTPMGGGSGVCGALARAAGELVMDMGAFAAPSFDSTACPKRLLAAATRCASFGQDSNACDRRCRRAPGRS